MSFPRIRLTLCASAIAMACAGTALADTVFTKPLVDFAGDVSASGPDRMPIYKGGKAIISGEEMIPGQTVTLMRGNEVLNAEPITVDDKGAFSFTLDIDAEAETGLQPVVVIAENPAAAQVVEMKISPEIPVSGADKFDVVSEPVTRGLYQVIRTEDGAAVFVTSAVGRPPVKESKLVRINPETLKIEAEA
ncbi:ATP-binding protein, partial [Paracoccus halophilus]